MLILPSTKLNSRRWDIAPSNEEDLGPDHLAVVDLDLLKIPDEDL